MRKKERQLIVSKSKMEVIDVFEIRTDVICNRYNNTQHPGSKPDKEITHYVGHFLLDKGCFKPTTQLFEDFLNRTQQTSICIDKIPDYSKWLEEGSLTGKCAKGMADQIRSTIDVVGDGDFNWNIYLFIDELYPIQTAISGVILNQRVEVDPKNDPTYFQLFFCFIFSKLPYTHKDKFLNYHSERSFKGNLSKYKGFLISCLDTLDKESEYLFLKDRIENYNSNSISRVIDKAVMNDSFVYSFFQNEEEIKMFLEILVHYSPIGKSGKIIKTKINNIIGALESLEILDSSKKYNYDYLFSKIYGREITNITKNNSDSYSTHIDEIKSYIKKNYSHILNNNI